MSQPASPRPLTPQDLQDRAAAAADAGRADEAERLLRIALKVAQGPQMLVRLGVALEYQGRYNEARAMFEAAVAVAPDEPRLGFPLALNLLREGRYEAGLPLYEAREIRLTRAQVGRPALGFPEWRGEPVRSLVIVPEQGLGDELMFNRYVPVLKARGVEVTLLCRPGLARVFEHLGAPLLPLGPQVAVPRLDAWTMSASLPLRLSTTPASIPPAAYLPAGGGGGGVGVMTRGSHDPDPRRSLPPEIAARLLALPGAVNLDPKATGARDFEDTRRIMEGLDLVISIDTAVAHLAGAMGKACWTLLPFTPDWRWGLGERSPWYPQMRLFRQPRALDWASVADAVEAAFAARG